MTLSTNQESLLVKTETTKQTPLIALFKIANQIFDSCLRKAKKVAINRRNKINTNNLIMQTALSVTLLRIALMTL